MEPLDYYVDGEFRQKQSRERKRRSEAEHRLYWFTYQRFTERGPQTFGKDSQALKALNRLLGFVRKYWTEHILSDRRICEQESKTHFWNRSLRRTGTLKKD